jgi:hypothetical protein
MANGLMGVGKPRATALSGMPPPAPPQLADQQQQQNQQPQQMPAPSHNMTVATMRHMYAIMSSLKTLIANPDLGKTDMKDAIIEGMTKLVADRMIPPAEAVTTLASVPDRPFLQKQWAMKQLQQADAARNIVLAHHAAAFAGQAPQPTPSPDNHMADMAGVGAQYSGGGNS